MTRVPERGFATRQVHVGGDAAHATPRATPIHLTAGFTFDAFEDAAVHFGAGDGWGYTRTGNPTVDAVERKLASLEGGTDAILLASGQAAITVALLGLLDAGSHIVCSNHIYEGTRGLLVDNLSRLGIETTFVDDIADPSAWRAAIRPETRVLFGESIANARNDVLDIAAIAAVGDETGIPLVVDNTFATPYLVRPLEHGAAIVVHSASKFLAGQGAVLGGVIVDDGAFDAARAGALFPHLVARDRDGSAGLWERHGGRARVAHLRDGVAPRFGPTPSPLNAFLIGQGAETLSLRVERQSANALAVARWLSDRPEVLSVDHAGLPTHPTHHLAKRYLRGGYGSVFTLTLRGGLPAAKAFVEALQVVVHMTHLGDVRSLVLHPGTTSHAGRSAQERAAAGVHPGTLRLSIGIEDVDDLIADLAGALAAAATVDTDSLAVDVVA
ncbi:aminotransferase class I/II-fold pyridoxal phosphate-dependent enzyme [Microbacterium sp. EYE_5]|uniref:O-acetylhomoserine aminocarboxypropyltransferase/cysteine synthase family protein n=1 Tax=unclassified Microbacterium TaxID=2609290 RepID=UPI0020047786|nr:MULTISPECIES: PLP-dependent transferase [unclassified Microbacterium]MCK6080895.1 aminotransferase class I/II-fold pyridoxal phosphate-dependent enzyme [Microbacterium sp. EYE_382]MCK6086166.1 aminotransferase class I/II-fold pyridoxal phosphate-dependent enzyme [Microbacterium sp. EYE_384]MCK6124336.1 aminotransferase class I/II-fold pyridoxal phosphate-dependent enzyme [Microbacterium sp. EYE_80]MCK6127245.1 aminotransferase class I/II-fold pyridoxal phosphate-dependent enzyme [Microbacter